MSEVFSKEFDKRLLSTKAMMIAVGILALSAIAFCIILKHNEDYLSVIGVLNVSDSDMIDVTKEVLSRNSWCRVLLCVFAMSAFVLIGSPIYAAGCAGLAVIGEKNRRKNLPCTEEPSQPEETEEAAIEPVPEITPEAPAPAEEYQPSTAFHLQRSDTHGKALSITVSDSFRDVFKPAFLSTNHTTNLNSYEIFKEQLESQGWKISDLGRIALMVFESRILLPKYQSKGFNWWMKDFCAFMGRQDDCPADPDKSSYKDFWKSSTNLASVFSNLKSWYDKTESDYICFEKPASESDRPS